MYNANYDIGEIENGLWQSLKTAKVCPVIYSNRRPSTVKKPADMFLVVTSVTEVSDRNAFGKNICRIEIFTKEVGGVKDSKQASIMSKKVMGLLPIYTDKYIFTYMSNISLGLDNTGYDVEAVNINVLIKK